MNERIKELAKKAGYEELIYNMCKEGLDKFAEVIIKECASHIKSMHNGHFYVIADELTEHFGVE